MVKHNGLSREFPKKRKIIVHFENAFYMALFVPSFFFI